MTYRQRKYETNKGKYKCQLRYIAQFIRILQIKWLLNIMKNIFNKNGSRHKNDPNDKIT